MKYEFDCTDTVKEAVDKVVMMRLAHVLVIAVTEDGVVNTITDHGILWSVAMLESVKHSLLSDVVEVSSP